MPHSEIDALISQALAIRKRDGREEAFKSAKITAAIQRAGEATGEFGAVEARLLTLRVVSTLQALREEGKPLRSSSSRTSSRRRDPLLPRRPKAYIIYRDSTAASRDGSKADLDLIGAYLNKLDWRVKGTATWPIRCRG